MKRLIPFLLFCLSANLAFSQTQHYEKAYSDLEDMLEGRSTLDVNKAVFIMENAWYDNNLSYTDFDYRLTEIANACKQMSGSTYKTAGNWAIFEWMTKKIPQNNYQSCEYNFDDFFGEKNHESVLVQKLLTDKIGTCLSMPLLYKCLANKLGVDAKITLGPSHAWIRHTGGNG